MSSHDPRCEYRDHDPATSTCLWRERPCVENWPECESMMYHPSCCRFPKSCSVDDVPVPPADKGPTLAERFRRYDWSKYGYWPRATVVKFPIFHVLPWIAIVPRDDGGATGFIRCRSQADAIAKIEEVYRTYVPGSPES